MDAILKASLPKLREKLLEALQAVLPIAAIVLALCFTIAPVSPSILLCFLLGAAMIVLGIMFFTLGAEMSMTPMGERVGAVITKSRKLPVILGTGFLLGFLITISEPDLQVLANQVASIPKNVLIWTVAVGVGVFLALAVLRIFYRASLAKCLLAAYALLFVLTLFSPKEFLAVAFDAGGVTTGPITVPFIMALGVGVSAIRSTQGHDDDSFGLVALCSVGPILMVLLLGIFYHPTDAAYSAVEIAPVVTTRDVARQFALGFPGYAEEVLLSILPIVTVFVLFQLLTRCYRRRQLLRTGVGFLYTVIGLILFLTGVNVGFTPVGNLLGSGLAGSAYRWVLIPIGALIGYYIVKAEPAVQVLNKQVEDVTGGTVSQSMMNTALSIGVACAVMLSMVRVLTGISIYWILVPGYALALILARFVPSVFVGIAFDSGGVASGPMTSTFLLPLAMGACTALGGNVVTDAFGVVALVALAPPVAIQIMGVLYVHRSKAVAQNKADLLSDDGVIDLEDEEI